jgi:hypothetical protein
MKGFNRTFKVHTLDGYKIVEDRTERCPQWQDLLRLERKG